MTKAIETFDRYAREYDAWFDRYVWVYRSEVEALRMLVPLAGKGVEIGVGTGRFSVPFGILTGVEPSRQMATIARSRGISVYEAMAEKLPFEDGGFDYALFITVLCFLDNPLEALRECRRILRPNGKIIIGMLDRDSPLGSEYERQKLGSTFFRHAHFLSVREVVRLLSEVSFTHIRTVQTIFAKPESLTAVEPVRAGHGEGLFVVVSGEKGA